METSSTQEIPVTLASITPILKLDKLQIRTHSRFWVDEPITSPDDVLPRYVVLRLLLADLLERLAFLSPSQRQTILEHYNQDNDESRVGRNQWTTLVFADGNWCTWSGMTGWLDLTSGDKEWQLPAVPLETVGYNLVVLYDRAMAQIWKRTSNAREHSAEGVDQPRDVRDSSPDAVS